MRRQARFPCFVGCADRPSRWRAPAPQRPMRSGLPFTCCARARSTVPSPAARKPCITFGTLRGWEAMRVMAPDTCRPFSIDRKGLVLGEGAAMLVLEPLERARARGAQILGEIVGFGMSADAADLTAPDQGGMTRAMEGALADGKLAVQLGAAGALEMVATLLAVREAIVPPTIGYLGPDPACDLDYVPNDARALTIDAALSNSFAFGGLNAVLAVKKFS